MTGTIADAPPAAQPPRQPMSTGDKVRFALRGIGQTLITLGLIVLLFVVYEVWITNIFSDHDNKRIASKLRTEWKQGENPLLPLPGSARSAIKVGTGIAEIYMPRLGQHYHFAIVQGTSQDSLALGPGHYTGTPLPGAVGNFAVAGHRVGKGEPFLNIDQLRSGDPVIIETKTDWFVYRVLGNQAGGDPQHEHQSVAVAGGKTASLPGREIVDPSNGGPLLPVPDHTGVGAAARLMTMTTCHPKFTAARRMIVYSMLQTRLPSTGSTMPPAISKLFDAEGS
ncbi:class E sortase [uncultured Jatrophihabitans sp.]|uniref:class E sortase n=1 Tax=uncultured Jatrophihabitans sp. TaxID=1610747 RepID=UPI0035CC3292